MAPPESVPSATVTDLATVRRTRARDAETVVPTGSRTARPAATESPASTSGTDAPERPAGRKVANRRFDAEKVERLKAEIADGRYRIDAESVADRFIEHERNN